MTAVATKHQQPVRSTIPARLDRPARYWGRTDIWINGSYWLGSILGTLAADHRLPDRWRRHDHRRPVEVFLGIDAEGKPLEQVARPLTEVGSGGDMS